MSGPKKPYEIGKGKPPKSTQFKPGQSGNPKGRPKGHNNLATEIEEILTSQVPISENGRKRKVTSRKAALMKLRKMALEGDGRAIDRFLELARAHAAKEAAAAGERMLNAAEDDILARYIRTMTGLGGTDQTENLDSTEVRDEESD